MKVKYLSLKKIFEKFKTNWIPTNRLQSLCPKSHLYELRPLLEHTGWCPKFDKKYNLFASGSEKISGYWRVSAEGLLFLEKEFQLNIDFSQYAIQLLKVEI